MTRVTWSNPVFANVCWLRRCEYWRRRLETTTQIFISAGKVPWFRHPQCKRPWHQFVDNSSLHISVIDGLPYPSSDMFRRSDVAKSMEILAILGSESGWQWIIGWTRDEPPFVDIADSPAPLFALGGEASASAEAARKLVHYPHRLLVLDHLVGGLCSLPPWRSQL